MMHLLFICSRNKWRSRTAEKIYAGHRDFIVWSAGTSDSAVVKVNADMIAWADIIFVMETKHRRILQQRFTETLAGKRLIVLDIPDEYEYMDSELVNMIHTSVDAILSDYE